MKYLDWFKRFPIFLRDVRLEVKKTSFPNKQEVTNTTLVVVVVVAIFGVYLWLVDQIVFSILNKVLMVFR